MSYLVFVASEKAEPIMRELGNARAMLPYTVAIDRDGRIVDSHLGALGEGGLGTTWFARSSCSPEAAAGGATGRERWPWPSVVRCGDGPGNVAVHGRQPRAWERLRVGEVLGIEQRIFTLSRAVAPA